jgi:hypothetical protein
MTTALPRVLQARAEKLLADIEVGQQRVPWSTAGSRTGGETVSFSLPQGIIDLHSLKIYFELAVQGGTFTVPIADAMIGGLSIDVAGTSVTAVPRYGLVASHLRWLTSSAEDRDSKPQSYSVNVSGEGALVVEGLLAGLLSGSHQRFIDTSLFKHVTLEITLPVSLEAVGFAAVVAPATSVSIAISNSYLTYSTVKFSRDDYRNSLRAMGTVRIPFNAWYTSTSPEHSSSINTPVLRASQSLNAIYVLRPSTNYATTPGGAFYESTSLEDTMLNIEVNGTNYYSSDLMEKRGQVRQATSTALATRGLKMKAGLTTTTWRDTAWLSATALSLPGGGDLVSGVNSYEASSPVVVKYSSPSATSMAVLVIAMECTSSIAIELSTGEISYRQ